MPISTTACGSIESLIARVKSEVDVQKLVRRSESAEDFGRYVRDRCLNPEHADNVPTMLVYHDGVVCPACGYKEDAIGLYRAMRPTLSFRLALEELLSGQWRRDEGADTTARATRQLDQALGIRYHFALVQYPEALAAWEAYGCTRRTIQRRKLGAAHVLVRLDQEYCGDDPDVEWREINGRPQAYQRQLRLSVPVYRRGQLVQVLYRKLNERQLGSKVTMEKDAGSWLFGEDDLENAEEALVCEGWGDKLVAEQWGFTAVTSTNGAGHWNADWNEALRNVKRLYVVGDADYAGGKLVQRVLKEIPWARPVELPYPLGSKADIRQFYLDGHSAAEFRSLLDRADIPAFRFQ